MNNVFDATNCRKFYFSHLCPKVFGLIEAFFTFEFLSFCWIMNFDLSRDEWSCRCWSGVHVHFPEVSLTRRSLMFLSPWRPASGIIPVAAPIHPVPLTDIFHQQRLWSLVWFGLVWPVRPSIRPLVRPPVRPLSLSHKDRDICQAPPIPARCSRFIAFLATICRNRLVLVCCCR